MPHICVVVNDSDESSFHFRGRTESFQDTPQPAPTKVRLKLDLQTVAKLRQAPKKAVVSASSSGSVPPAPHPQHEKVTRLQLQFPNGEPLGYHQMFMQKINEFSESWR